MTCNLQIIDAHGSRMMILAGAMIVLGIIFRNLPGLALYSLGWILVAYNLTQTMPENKNIFIPAIAIIILSTFGILEYRHIEPVYYTAVGFYVVAWLVFGYFLSTHLEGPDRLAGVGAALLLIVATFFINNPFGAVAYTVGWGVISTIYSIPTLDGLTTSAVPCLADVLSRYPDAQCFVNSQCLQQLLQTNVTGGEYIKQFIDAIICASNSCPSKLLKDVASSLTCMESHGCLAAIEQSPPRTMQDLETALVGLIACKALNGC